MSICLNFLPNLWKSNPTIAKGSISKMIYLLRMAVIFAMSGHHICFSLLGSLHQCLGPPCQHLEAPGSTRAVGGTRMGGTLMVTQEAPEAPWWSMGDDSFLAIRKPSLTKRSICIVRSCAPFRHFPDFQETSDPLKRPEGESLVQERGELLRVPNRGRGRLVRN